VNVGSQYNWVYWGTAGQAEVALEDTANASAFSDALRVAVFSIKGIAPAEGVTFSNRITKCRRFGAPNAKLRFNVVSIAGGGTLTAHGAGWNSNKLWSAHLECSALGSTTGHSVDSNN
jgi:hypothetical protein